MKEIKGLYNNAKVFASIIEPEAEEQIKNMVNQKFTYGSNIAIMPDAHSGSGCTIGTTMTIKDKVVPNLVGVDVGCGMLVQKIAPDFTIDLPRLDEIIHNEIPSGFHKRKITHPFANKIEENLHNIIAPINIENSLRSIGTLGGGNHFIEVDKDADGNQYIVIHSGSRHLGIEVAKFHQMKAFKNLTNNTVIRENIIKRCKSEGREKDIQKELDNIKTENISFDLAYLEGEDFSDYINDMFIAQYYASLNREAMLDVILNCLKIPQHYIQESFCTIHNYIDIESMILRKGAISLLKDEIAIIPMNMRDGSLIVKGKGNPEWNYSGPHGAGRLMSRTKAKKSISMEDFNNSMNGIYSSSINELTLDEAPMAYKDMKTIIEDISPTAEIINTIKPVYNFKASE